MKEGRKPLPRPSRKSIGLGDAVEMIAQPIAKGIDRVIKTDFANCAGCSGRKEFLNKISDFLSGDV